MDVGVVFPTYEIGNDPGLIRDFVQSAEALGYKHITIYDNVLGADPDREGWRGPHTIDNPFHEALTMIAYMAGITKTIGFMTAILVLPQRQAALVAKQAGQIEILAPGRLRLGVGVGWNAVEFEALGMDFSTRGKYLDEQLEVINKLWTEPMVDYTGKWHRIDRAGLTPFPPNPVPIWFGGYADAALKRAAKWGSGWVPIGRGNYRETREKLDAYLRAEGRDPEKFGVECMLNFQPGRTFRLHQPPDPNVELADVPELWRAKVEEAEYALGATHGTLMTMDYGLPNPQAHLDAIRRYAEAVFA